MKLAEVKNKQNNFRSNLGETKRGSTNSKDQKKTKKNTNIVIILQWYLKQKQKLKQNKKLKALIFQIIDNLISKY